jgi:hypothetical protein
MVTNDAELIQMERTMRSAPEPGGLENVTMGDDGVTVSNTSVESAGYVVMWNTDTRDPSTFNMNSVRAKLREVFPKDHPRLPGQPAWTAVQPETPPWRGDAVCPLHASSPDRAEYDKRGYPECDRIHLPNEMEAQEHLRKKHPQTWRMLREAGAEEERKSQSEDRDINRMILAKLAGVDLDEPMAQPSVPTKQKKKRSWEKIQADKERMAKVRAARAAKKAQAN